MTVRELLEQLAECHPDALVVLSADEEGNSFSPCVLLDEGAYDDGERAYGPDMLDDDAVLAGLGPEDIVTGPRAVCLWPAH